MAATASACCAGDGGPNADQLSWHDRPDRHRHPPQSDNATIRSMPGDNPRSEAHSGIRFVDRGAKLLEGISDESRLFAVAQVN